MTEKRGWKMRYAPHIGLMGPDAPLFLETVGSADPVAQIDYLASLGFSGIEDNFLRIRPPEMQERMGAALAGHGMEMGCAVNNPMHWNRPLWGIGSEEARAQLKRDLTESIAAAKRAGGKYLTVVTAHDTAMPAAYQRTRMVEDLKRLAPMAEEAGVILALETVDTNRWPGMLMNHVPEAYEMVKAVGSPAVKLVFDFGHIAPMDGRVIENLTAVFDEIAIIQASDIPGRLELGSGELNWVNIFRTIRRLGYTGLIELEHMLSVPGLAGEKTVLDNLRAIDDAV
jgi:hydroxypyruvate isomerase